MVKSMTEGSPTKAIISFTLPILIGNVFQQFYNMADTIIVGKTLGSKALAGVGSTGTISFLFFGLIAECRLDLPCLPRRSSAREIWTPCKNGRLRGCSVSGDNGGHDGCHGFAYESSFKYYEYA